MSFKNISKLFIFLILLFSCKSIEVLKEKKNIYYEYDEVKEDSTFIELIPTSSVNDNFIDYYSSSNTFKYIPKAKINKLHTLNSNTNKELESKARFFKKLQLKARSVGVKLMYKNKIAGYKQAKKIIIIDDLNDLNDIPKGPTKKVLYRQLQKYYMNMV